MSMLLHRSRVLLISLAVLIAGVVIAGCDAPTESSPLPPLPSPQPGILNVIHAVSDAPAIDVYLDDDKLVSGLDYRKSSGNLTAPAGLHALAVRQAEGGAMAAPLWQGSIYLQEGQKLLLTAVGRLADHEGETAFHLTATTFGNGDAQTLRMRLLNAAPSRPKLDLTVGSDGIFYGVEFGHVSTSALTKWSPSSAIDAKLGLAATGKTAAQAMALGQAALQGTFATSSVLTLIALGDENPLFDDVHFFGLSLFDESSGTLQDLSLVLNDSGPAVSLYVYQASSDSQAIDLYSDNGARLAGGLAYNSASNLLSLPPGSYNMQVRASGSGAVLGNATFKLVPNTQWALFTTGLRSAAPPGRGLTLYAAPLAQKGSGKSWRVIHAVLGGDALALQDDSEMVLAQADYAHATPYRTDSLPVGTLKLHPIADPTQIWSIVIPQSFASSVRDEVTTLYLTGSSTNPAQPLSAVALVESTAAATRMPTLMPLSTTK